MNETRVTEAYTLGIREGRATLRHHLDHGLSRAEAIDAERSTARTLAGMGFAGDMGEFNRGVAAFWRNQARGGN